MRRIAVAILFLTWVTAIGTALPARAANGYDVADHWWNPSESGWGLQLTQQSHSVFATMYLYDDLGYPFWYVALLTFQGLNAAGGPIYSGTIYEGRGPHWAGPYNPAHASTSPVGSMTFNSPTTSTATLSYVINGISVTKQVERFTLAYENFNGSYTGVYLVTQTGCSNPIYNGTSKLLTTFSISQNASAMTMVAAITDGSGLNTCTFTGTYTPRGSIGDFNGNYGCSSGESGTVRFAEMGAQRFAILGRISAGRNNLGCSFTGRFSATEN